MVIEIHKTEGYIPTKIKELKYAFKIYLVLSVFRATALVLTS